MDRCGFIDCMKPPIYVRELSEAERKALKADLRSSAGFTIRRCQILLSSAAGKQAKEIAAEVHCSDETVRKTIRAFEAEGLTCLTEKSHARHDQKPAFDAVGLERLKEMTRLSPRAFGHETSVWTRALLAESCHREGLTENVLSETSMTEYLHLAGIDWRRAKKRKQSPDRHYEHRKKDEID